jgi:hypothetical protein
MTVFVISQELSSSIETIVKILSSLLNLGVFDLVFVITAIAFNLLITGIFIAQKKGRIDLVRKLGIAWLGLSVPLGVVFLYYLREGRETWIMVYFGLIFLYIFVELLLDYILKFDFRRRWRTHIPYIVLEYIALFGLIGISFSIHPTWGYLVTISFWVLLASLIYLYWGKSKKQLS